MSDLQKEEDECAGEERTSDRCSFHCRRSGNCRVRNTEQNTTEPVSDRDMTEACSAREEAVLIDEVTSMTHQQEPGARTATLT